MFAAPALGPMLSGFAVIAEESVINLYSALRVKRASPIFILWFFFLPETSADNILLRRATRLRKALDKQNIRSQTKITRGDLSFGNIA
ncbi:multidrug transporter [Penicillium odoratum]|uniref:multidrug transporter n=1 Tax=Penicillium odoratum TaxID=1167516 RepID=UPI002548D595|nr:multidrug transporter [Penicillium odoratum]KAJ5745081.1 multidrug transporter [Penicillium odoratum]